MTGRLDNFIMKASGQIHPSFATLRLHFEGRECNPHILIEPKTEDGLDVTVFNVTSFKVGQLIEDLDRYRQRLKEEGR